MYMTALARSLGRLSLPKFVMKSDRLHFKTMKSCPLALLLLIENYGNFVAFQLNSDVSLKSY